MKSKILILSIFVFSVSGCGQTNTSVKKDNHTKFINSDNAFLGEWYSVKRPYPFGATLEIGLNHNFIYEGGACDYHFMSKGEWLLKDDTLILNSFEPKECYFISEFGVKCTIITSDFTPPERKTSMKGCKPNTEREYILFKNEKFIIEDSLLTHIQKTNTFCPGHVKDNFTKKAEKEVMINKSEETREDAIWVADVEVEPLFDGKPAEIGFREYINKNLIYPIQHEATGRVIVEFVIEKDSSISNAKVIRGLSPLFDAEALRVINSSPKWTPGKMRGETVRVRAIYGVIFKLVSADTEN
jgi:hypothetical protein